MTTTNPEDAMHDFDVSHLSSVQRAVACAVLGVVHTGNPDASGGGCRAFYSPKEWAERGEEYGRESVLIICHDGGSLAPFCRYDYGDYDAIARLDAALRSVGYYVEQCTSWYSAVYPTPSR